MHIPWTIRRAIRSLATLALIPATFLTVTGQPVLPTRGTEFHLGFMQNAYGAQELRIYISSPTANSGTVEMPLIGWSQTFSVPANGTALVVVPNSAEHIGSEVVSNKSVRITCANPATVSAVSFQSFTNDGAQVLPTQGLGTEYVVDAYRGLPGFNEFYKSELLIVATADNTQIQITPTVNTAGGRPAGVPFNITLNAGETYQVQSALSSLDLSGTTVMGTAASGPCRPFAVFGGSMCANVPVGCPACDHLYEQMIPVEHWGTNFHTFRMAGFNTYTTRVLARQNGTSVTLNGGTPIVLNAGQRHEFNGLTAPACINASAPISAVQVFEGYNCSGAGDPAMVVLEPDPRTTRQAVFSTVNTPQVSNHRVNIVIPTAHVGTLTLNGAPVSPAQFQPYGTCSGMSHASLIIPAGNHRLASTQGFHAYVHGFGTGESYAFTANSVHVPVQDPDSTLCAAGPITLTVPNNWVNTTWEAASAPGVIVATGNSWSFTPTLSDSYIAQGELPVSGCPMVFTYHVGLPVPLNLTATANGSPATTICQYEGVQLGSIPTPNPAFFNINWTPANLVSDPHIPDPMAYPTATTWFKLNVVSPIGCGSAQDSVLVQVTPNELLGVKATVDDSALCLGETTVLRARAQRVVASDHFNNGTGPMWISFQGGSPANTCGSMAGNAMFFSATGPRTARTNAFNMTNGGEVRFALKIAAGAPPCEDADPGDDVVLEYTLNAGITWTVMAVLAENAFPSFTEVVVPVPPAAYGPSTGFRWRQLAHSGTGQDVWALDNVIITRTDNSIANFTWSPSSPLNNASSANPTVTPVSSGWFTIQASGASGCTFLDSVYLHVAPPFQLTATNDTTLCSPGSVGLLAIPSSGNGITWSWSPNNGTLNSTTIPGPTATPTATTTYTVNAVSDIGCTATEQVTITIGQPLSVTASANPATICLGGTSQLQAVPQGSNTVLTWAPATSLSNPNSTNPVATPPSTTTYVATLTDPGTGCSVSAGATVTVLGGYTLQMPPDTTLCNTLGHQLNIQHNVPAPFTILWSPANMLNSATIASPTIMFDTSMVYTVTVTDAAGCSVTDSVTILDAFDNLITPVNLSACQGQSIVLDAGYPGSSYSWSHGPTTQVVVVSSTDVYSVQITDPQGCQTFKVFHVTIHPNPTVDLGPDLWLCGANSQLLSANNAGNTVLWSTGQQSQQITVSASGVYAVIVTNPQGCTASDSVQVTFNPLPVDQLNDMTVCVTNPPTLDAGNTGSTYQWSTGEQTQTIVAGSSGTYTVTVTNTANCTATFDAIVLLVGPPIVELGPDTTLCQGQALMLDAGGMGTTYLWNTGQQTQTITPVNSGTYSVEVGNGPCNVTDAITVTFLPLPVDQLQDATACTGTPITLNAGGPSNTYAWSTGENTPSITVDSPGTYIVVVTGANGCAGTFDAAVTYVPPPSVELGPDTVLCQGDVLVLDATNPGSTYAWSTGAITPTIDVMQTGTYTVTVDNGHCDRSDALSAVFNPRPAYMSVHQLFTCLDEAPGHVQLDAGNPGSGYVWSTGATNQVILANAYGWYFVDITNQFDCSLRDSVQVNEFCPATLYIPNTFTPNGDGINDTWGPVGKNIARFELYVFDRWGGILFQSNEPQQQWDGMSNGEVVKNDVYVWRVRYRFFEDEFGKVGMEHERTGHVQVLR